MSKKNRLIVISFDALIFEDVETLSKMPAFKWLMENGSMVQRMRSVYPTLTYPCHVSMASGCYPDKHGVTSNEKRLPGVRRLPWNFDHAPVKVPDIMDACKKAGLTTASAGWPCTGNHPSIDYLLDEVWPIPDADASEYRRVIIESGTGEKLYKEVVEPYLYMRIGRKQPESSYFSTRISCDIIRRYKPDLLTLHVGNIDHYRHRTGLFSDRVTLGLYECDRILADLITATKDAGVFEETNFVATADHGQLDGTRSVFPNVLLKKHGFIRTDEAGNVTDWDAWSYTSGMSAQIVLRDPENETIKAAVHEMLQKYCDEGVWGFSRVYTAEEAREEERLAGDFAFVLETDGYSSFGNEWMEPYVKSDAYGLCGPRHGSHGHHPDKGPSPTWIGGGPAFKKGVVIPNARLVDGAPTCARILGVELPDADGSPLDALLN